MGTSFTQVGKILDETVHMVDSTSADLSAVKFLAGAFWCEVSEIDFSRVADNLA